MIPGFLTLPIQVFNQVKHDQMQALGVEVTPEYNTVPLKVIKSEICAWRPDSNDEQDEFDARNTTIYLKSGESFVVNLTVDEFEALFFP